MGREVRERFQCRFVRSFAVRFRHSINETFSRSTLCKQLSVVSSYTGLYLGNLRPFKIVFLFFDVHEAAILCK